MNLRSNALTVAVAGFAIVGGFLAVSQTSHQSFAIVQSATAASAMQNPESSTFKIVAADVMAPMLAASPLTGDASN